MTFVVPFDGSALAEAALVRASEFSTVLDERVLAVVVVPDGNERYARERDWLGADEAFDLNAVVGRLHEQVTDLAPDVDFRHEVVDKRAPMGAVTTRLKQVARDEDASMVFVGSENAGRMVTGLGSVGSSVAADDSYDVVIVRHRAPTEVTKLRDAAPRDRGKPDFY
ncbi:UspA domain protein [Halobacterium hubeiense]|uniref:UspA domain protein n=1 Tax=Halobacterium hubeiense TaxID=1407499 RepID=A0A0U5CVQ2_9EURY|nr:universal stress protein [Halobacterium hubeiense]CQH48591.1 UspA domain protein [Halobacterium hubeiense]